jgi:hypothetical protein
MPNFTVSKTVHIILYIVAAILVALTHLASSGNIALTGPVVAILGFVLSAINSVDPETVAQTLPAAKLAAMADAKRLSASEAPTK